MNQKRVKRTAIRTAIMALIVACVFSFSACVGINLFSCSKNSDPSDAPETTVNISAAPPTDGTLPTAHTGIENISYMVYVLNNQTSWHSYSDTDSIAAGGINNQKTYTYKDYKDGVLIASDMTYSTFVQSSTQTAYIGDGAYARTGSKPSKTSSITDIVWDDGEPEYLERQSYYEKYGLFADEISVFLLNEETVSSSGDVTDNGDGTYTQSFTLDPVASSYYYQYNMYTRGGLSAYPEFSTVNITFTFDAQWQVLEVQTYEVSQVSMGIISTTNTSESHITYTYGDDCIDEYNYAFYESYFKQYVGNVSEGSASVTDDEMGVAEVLQYGFGEVLSGGKQYAIDVVIGETAYTGYIYASVDLNTLSADTLGAMDIRLSLGKTADEQMLYIELSDGEIAVYYSDSFAVSGNLSELSLLIDQISSWIGTLGETDGGAQTVALAKVLTESETSSDDEEDTLTELLKLIVITETENGVTLSLKTDDLLGVGIGIDMTMEFAKDDESVLTFTGATVNSISYGGEELAVNVTLSDTEAEVITRNEEMTPASLSDFVADVYDLLSAELLEIKVTMDGSASSYSSLDGLTVEATALLDISSVMVGADLYVSYATEAGSLSAKLAAYYNYGASEYGDIYLYLYELDGKSVDVKVYCDISELADTITLLLGGDTEDADEAAEEVSQSVAQIINSVLSLDFSKVVTRLYASGSQICLGVDLDTIMALLGADSLPTFGTAALIYDGGSLSLALEALGLSIDVEKASGEITAPELSEYLDITKVAEEIYALISSRTFNITLVLDGDGENCTITQLSGLSVTLDAAFDAQSLVLSSGAEISYTSGGNVISAKLDIHYVYSEENYGTVYVNLYEICGKAVEVKLCADISDIDELIGGLISGITDSIELSAAESIELSAVLEAVIAFDFSSVIAVLQTSPSQIELGLDVDSILSQLGVDFEGVGVVGLVYGDGAFTVTSENLGLSAAIGGNEDEVALPEDTEEYLNITEIISAVNGLINSESITAELAISDSNISYLEDVTLNCVINYTVASGLLEVELTASYQDINVVLTAYYDGEAIYLAITEIAGAETDIKVKCGIDELSALLESLLGETSTEVSVATSEVLEVVLALNYGEIITELKANADEGILLGIDVDELLTELEVSLEIELGEIVLSYNNGELAIEADYAGVTASVSGISDTVELPENTSDYLDIAEVIDEIKALIEANSYEVTITLNGDESAIEQLAGIEAVIEAKIDINALAVAADVSISYNDISAKLEVYYSYAEETYGTAYVRIYELCGRQVEVKACGTIGEVLELIGVSLEQTEGAEISVTLDDILSAVLALDYSSIIANLEAGADGVNIAVNADGLLNQLEVNLGIELGEVAAVYSKGEISLAVANLGLGVKFSGSESAVTFTDDTASYIDITALVSEIEDLINSETFTAELAISDSNISYLEDVTLNCVINYTVASGLLEVELIASYQDINVVLMAYYDGGAIYLAITEIAGAETDIKVKCGIDELSALLESLLGETSTEVSVATSEVLEVVLALNYGEIITELKANADEGILLGIDVDELLTELEVSLGIELGEIVLSYNNGELALAADYAGVTASVSGTDGAVELPADAANYLDIIEAAKDIYSIIQSDIINVYVSIDGGELLSGLVDGGYLDGVALEGVVSFTTDFTAVYADFEISYTYGGEGVSLGLQAYYDGAAVYLLIDEINGAAASIGVSCGIDTLSEALTQILALAESGGSGESTGSEQAAADIVTVLLAMDYQSMVKQLTAYDNAIVISVDVDSVLNQLAVNGIISDSLSGYAFGVVTLAYNGNGELALAAENLGAEITLSGASGTLICPAANYLSVESVVALVESVMAEADGIEASQSVYFDIDTYVTAEELTLGIYGAGEVDWSGESVTVALDLYMYIADGASNPDKINLKLLYSASSVTLVMDELGITVTSDDISGLQDGFTQLLTAIYALAGTSGSSLEATSTVSAVSGVDVSGELNSLLANGDLSEILTALLGIVSSTDWAEGLARFTLNVDGTSAALGCLDGYTLTFTADGGFALTCVSEGGNENYIKVCAGVGLYASVESDISSGDYVIMGTDDVAELTEVIYNYGLGLISGATIANTLGSDTYEISLTLDGDNTGVSSLQGVYVEATLYYTDTVSTAAGDGKLTEMDVSMDIGGVTVVFNIIYYEESLYITLTNINDTDLHDLKFTIALGDVYDIADQLVEVLLNTNLIDFFVSGTTAAVSNEIEITEETATSISETLVKLLSLDFSKLVGCAKIVEDDGTITRTVWVDIDAVYNAFAESENGIGLGTVSASIVTYTEGDKTRRAIEVSGVYNEAVWLGFMAGRTTARDYSAFDTTEYWDLAFLKYLISDAVDFATDDSGDIYTIYTFSGNLEAVLDISIATITIPIDVINLTVGFDESGNFYMTLLGDLDTTTVLGMTVTDDWLFGFNIAYSSEYGGFLVTCANNLGTESAQYRVMTLNYLTDNLLKSDSCLKFMLGTNSTLWNLICSGLEAGDISLDSGISTPDELYLTNSGYTLDSVTSGDTSEFDIASFITGINAYIDGESYSCGTTNVSYDKLASQIDSSDYYAIDLNNDTMDSLTGGGITEIYAAILRNADGISGLVANGYIGGVMGFTLNLTYNEGIDEEYDLLSGEGTLVYEQVEAAESDFYAEATEVSDGSGYYVIDESGNYVYTEAYGSEDTLYAFSNETYYINNGDGTYSLATSYDSTATYYTANYSSDITSFYAPNLYNVVIANYGSELDYDRVSYSEGSTDTFGCFTLTYDGSEWIGEYADQTELYSFTLTVIYPDESQQQFTLKYTSAIYAEAASNTFENGDLYVYYIVTYDEKGNEVLTPMGSSYTFTGDTTLLVKLVEYQVTVNGIVYTFDADSNGYNVSGVSGEGYSGAILELESEINGYEVTGISAGAFGSVFVSGSAYGSVTTIVLPESITTIGGRAFYACTNLQSVVCLADAITLETDGTTSGLGSDHGYPFYDCSSSLTLYYTNLDSSVDSSKCFEYYESWWTYYPVNTVTSGWTYTRTAVASCDDEGVEAVIESALASYNGINVTVDIESLTEEVQNAVDAYMLENYGYVGYYRVSLSTSAEADGKYVVISASIASGYGEYYLFDITSLNGTVSVNADDGDVYAYNGGTYVLAGASIYLTVSANSGNRFTGFSDISGYDGEIEQGTAFTMPAGVVSLTANYETYFETLYIISAVQFTYDGTVYGSGTVSISGEYTAASTLSTPVAEGYIFLGWAYDKDGTLTFADEYMITDTYYAIWGVSSQTVTDYTVATSGTTVCDLTADGYTFLGWWINADGSWSQAVEVSNDTSVIYEALWCSSVSVNATYTTSTSGSFIKTYKVSATVTISGGELSGAFADEATKSYGSVSGTATYGSSTSTLSFSGSDGTYTASASHIGGSAYSGVTVTFDGINYSYGDWSVTVGDGTYSAT